MNALNRDMCRWIVATALIALLFSVAWHQGIRPLSSQDLSNRDDIGRNPSNGQGDAETIYVPALLLATAGGQAAATATPQLLPTDIPTAVPTSRPTETATATPTPVSSDLLRFEGTTNQGQTVVVEAYADLSAVTKFEMEAQVTCPNNSGTVTINVMDEIGYPIRNNRFVINVDSIGGNQHLLDGTITGRGSQIAGSWLVWLDGSDMLQPCKDKGSWEARLQPLGREHQH